MKRKVLNHFDAENASIRFVEYEFDNKVVYMVEFYVGGDKIKERSYIKLEDANEFYKLSCENYKSAARNAFLSLI